MNSIRYTPEEWAQVLGQRLRAQRLAVKPGLTQKALADKASIGLATVKRLEEGKPTSLVSFISVVKALGLSSWLLQLPEADTFSPLDFMNSGLSQRQRAYTPRKKRS